jgi:hypothetical protein
MSSNEQRADAFRQSLQATMEPVRLQLAAIEREIEQREAEIIELRKLRTEARRMVAILDPGMVIQGRPKAKEKRNRGSGYKLRAASETTEKVHVWLQENITNGEAFSAPELVREKGYDLTSQSMLGAVLHQLADAGVIRLDSYGDPENPGRAQRKNYKLVS